VTFITLACDKCNISIFVELVFAVTLRAGQGNERTSPKSFVESNLSGPVFAVFCSPTTAALLIIDS
jgi:hypothetical protein